jgi:hypothetical protein
VSLTVLAAIALLAATKLECSAAHQDAQRLRKEHHLRAAHEKLLVCARDPCPAVVQSECVPWLAEVERAMPTVVFEARMPDGSDVPGMRVSVDGVLAADRLDGRPVEIDPGEHVVRFDRPSGAPIERRIVVSEGEKARIVRIDVPVPAPVPTPVPVPVPEEPKAAPMPWTFYALGGAGLVSLGAFAVFGLSGLNGERGLDDCSPTCSASRIDSVRRDYIVADVFLAVGVIALGAATVVALTRPASSPRAAYLPSFERSMLK